MSGDTVLIQLVLLAHLAFKAQSEVTVGDDGLDIAAAVIRIRGNRVRVEVEAFRRTSCQRLPLTFQWLDVRAAIGDLQHDRTAEQALVRVLAISHVKLLFDV